MYYNILLIVNIAFYFNYIYYFILIIIMIKLKYTHVIYNELYTEDVINDPPRYETRGTQYVVDTMIYKSNLASSVGYNDQT